jgi:hypothetical protein
MRPDRQYRRAFLILFALVPSPYFERRAFSVPDATGSGMHSPWSGLPARLMPDPDECERCMIVELDLPKNVFHKGQPVSINYKIINKSKTLTAEFDVYYGPHKAIAFSAFSTTTGERLPTTSTRKPKILGVRKTLMFGPGDTYAGTFLLDREYDFSKPGIYRIVGNKYFAIFNESMPILSFRSSNILNRYLSKSSISWDGKMDSRVVGCGFVSR